MEKKTFLVPNISCEHCVHTVESEVSELPGVRAVHADESSKQVTVEWDAPTTWPKIEQVLTEINYPPAQP